MLHTTKKNTLHCISSGVSYNRATSVGQDHPVAAGHDKNRNNSIAIAPPLNTHTVYYLA